MSARNTWTAYNVNGQTGAIIWRLGGKQSSFKLGPGASFAFQHHVRLRANNEITIFDDGAGPPAVHKQSRGLTLRLDTTQMTATVVGQDEHHPGLLAYYEGSVQPQYNGDEFVGWGQWPYFTEFNARGATVFDARFVGANSSYRAYRFRWTGTPAIYPAVTARVNRSATTVYASWNGSTLLNKWRILTGPTPNALKPVTTVRKLAFETSIPIQHAGLYVAAQALDDHQRVLATSKPVKVP